MYLGRCVTRSTKFLSQSDLSFSVLNCTLLSHNRFSSDQPLPQLLKKSAKLRLVRLLPVGGAKSSEQEGLIIDTMTMNLSQLHNHLDDTKLRSRTSIEITRRLIDQSFLQLKVSRRSLYAAQQSKEQLERVLNTADSSSVLDEVSAIPVAAKKRRIAVDSTMVEKAY